MARCFTFSTLILILFASCINEEDNTFRLNEPFIIQYGESMYNPAFNIIISFESVPEDSRCPEGCYCIWEGNAKASFVLYNLPIKKKFELDTHHGENYLNERIVIGYSIRLISLYRES